MSQRFCLALAFLPLAAFVGLLLKVFPVKKMKDREPAEVAQFISNFLNGTGGEWDWDDFTSVPITHPALEAIRAEAEMVQLPLNPTGRLALESLLKRTKALEVTGSANQAIE